MDERPLECPGDVFLRSAPEEPRDALGDVERHQDETEHREECDRREPGQERPHRPVAIGRAEVRLQTRRGARYERGMAEAPVTLEGWYTLHEMWAVDWGRWNALPIGERDGVV